MIYYDSDVIRSKLENLLTKEKSFNNFSGITREEIQEIRHTIQDRKKNINGRAEWIANTMFNITDTRSKTQIVGFDKKIIYLIEALDPYCYTYKKFIAMDTPNSKKRSKEINKLPEKERLIAQREEKERYKSYKEDIETRIAIFEPKLIKYELAYIKYLNSIKLNVTESLKDILYLITINHISLDFDSISAEKYQEIKDNTQEIKIYTPKSLNSLIGSIDYNYDTLEEKIIELINNLDKKYEMLKIFQECSKWSEMYQELRESKRITIYNNNDKDLFSILIKLEKILNNRFEIVKKSDWQI